MLTALALCFVLSTDVCDHCRPKRLCEPHAEQVDAGLREARSGMKSKDAAERLRGLDRAGELNRGHANAPSKDVTKLIASALEDDDLEVRARAAELLRAGQDPDTALKALAKAIPDIGGVLDRVKGSHPDAAAAGRYAIGVVESLASYRDDRSVEALGELLSRHPAAIYGDVVYSVVDGLAGLGAREGVEALLGYYALMESLGSFPKLERHLHDRLTDVAARSGLEAPAWNDEGTSEAWAEWFKAHERELPKKLGKAEPPTVSK